LTPVYSVHRAPYWPLGDYVKFSCVLCLFCIVSLSSIIPPALPQGFDLSPGVKSQRFGRVTVTWKHHIDMYYDYKPVTPLKCSVLVHVAHELMRRLVQGQLPGEIWCPAVVALGGFSCPMWPIRVSCGCCCYSGVMVVGLYRYLFKCALVGESVFLTDAAQTHSLWRPCEGADH